MKPLNIFLIVLGIVAVLVVGSCAGLAFVFFWFAERATVQGVDVALELPDEVALGETFPIVVTVVNHADEPQTLDSIDIYNSLLEGFNVLETDPLSSGQPLFGEFRTFDFQRVVPPGEALEVRFNCRASSPGLYEGDVDVCINTPYSFVTRVGRIRVRDAAGPEGAETAAGDRTADAPAAP